MKKARSKRIAAWVGLVIWVGIWGTGCVPLKPREDENLKFLGEFFEDGLHPVWGSGVIYLISGEERSVIGIDTATRQIFTVYTLPLGFGKIGSDMDISPELSTLVFPAEDSSGHVWLFLIDTLRGISAGLKDSIYVGLAQYCRGCRPRFSINGDSIFFVGGEDGSKLLVWDLISDIVDTVMEAPGFFQDLLPQDTGFVYGKNPFKTYSFNTGLGGELPNTEGWDYIEVNPIYRDCAVCWKGDTVILLYDLLDLTGKTKAVSPYINNGGILELSWSPDGRSIVFICEVVHSEPPVGYELWIYRSITDFF